MAKPLTRLVRTIANKMGYDLLRLQKTNIHHEAVSGHGRGGGFDAFEAVVPRPVKALDIYFRSCARIEIHGQERKRIVDAPKQELLLRCLNRLVLSINNALDQKTEAKITLHVADDHSDPECIDGIKGILSKAKCETELINLETVGNGPSVGAVLRHAKSHASDLIYFVEDDYLHAKNAVQVMLESYGRLSACAGKGDVVLFPTDYPDRYRNVAQSLVLLGSDRHWRTIDDTTFTIVTSKNLIEKYWDFYIALEGYGIDHAITEAATINRVYETVPCFSPMKSLAVHLQHFDTLAPFVDWRQWWDEAALDDDI